MKFTLAAAGLLAVAQVAYACQDKTCGEDDPSCISACVDQINKCVSDCGGGSSCYQQCISEWTPTITNSAGSAVSTSDPLGTATADISGYSTVSPVSAAAATATGSLNTAAGASTAAPLSGSAAASLDSASASLATAFSSATLSLQSGFSASLSAASSSIAGAASSASASTSASSAAVESASSSAKIIYTVCAVAALALAF
ncbi:hypothetical protein VKS41_008487 [Umbelopsis sp. WA50703]